MANGSASSNFGTKANNFYLTEGTGINVSTDPLSAVVWSWMENEITGGKEDDICCQEDGPGSGRVILSIVDNGPDDLTRSVIGGNTTLGTIDIPEDAWRFIAVTFAGGTGNLKTYVDNVSDVSTSDTGEDSDGDYRLGAHKADTTNNNFDGLMSFFQMYNIELTVSQLEELQYNPFAFPANLQWFPDLLDPSEASFRDLSPQQRGAPAETGTITRDNNGPPVFLLGGQ